MKAEKGSTDLKVQQIHGPLKIREAGAIFNIHGVLRRPATDDTYM